MARDNNPMSLHLLTRAGYVQIDTMRTMQEQQMLRVCSAKFTANLASKNADLNLIPLPLSI